MLGLHGIKEHLEHQFVSELIDDLARDGYKELPTVGTIYWKGGDAAEIELTRLTVQELEKREQENARK